MRTITNRYFYSRAQKCAIDNVASDGLSLINLHSLEQIRERFPDAEIMEWEEVERLHREAHITGPIEITERDFIDALEVLPPMHWHRSSNGETFKLCEFHSGDITSIYCRIGGRYFTFLDSATMKHDEICRRCYAFAHSDMAD